MLIELSEDEIRVLQLLVQVHLNPEDAETGTEGTVGAALLEKFEDNLRKVEVDRRQIN
jgi:hypothetical protein